MEEKPVQQGKITISDVADALGVSKTTVSRAISGKGRISAATRNRVLTYIEEHNFKPSTIAKGLAQSKTFNICVTIPSDSGVSEQLFFQKVLIGMCNYLSIRDYDVVIANVEENDFTNLQRIITNQKVDGVIVTRTTLDGKMLSYLKETGIPFVTLGRCEEPDVVQIDSNHTAGCRELTSLLLMRGMKKIALLGGNTKHVVTQSRYRGFELAFRDQGKEPDRALIYENMTSPVLVEKAVDDLLRKGTECILCMDDSICSMVLRKCSKDGISIPKDIRVASFFNSSILENNRPAVTCLDFDINEEGIVAGKTILDLLSGEEVTSVTSLGYQVILKDSIK